MRVTQIKQQQKRQDRYSIYIDGKFSFGLSEGQLVELGLKEGQEFSESELEELKRQADIGKAYARAVRYLAIRPRSRWELETYLKRKGYEPDVIAGIMEKMEDLGLIDDAKFARLWVEYRQNTATRSRLKLQSELRAKRIDTDLIDDALADIGDEDELASIKDLIDRKSKQGQYQDKQKLMAYLGRQGFNYGLIKQAFEELEA